MARRPGAAPVYTDPEHGFPDPADKNVEIGEFDGSPRLFIGTMKPIDGKQGAFSASVWKGGIADGFAIPAGMKFYLKSEVDDAGESTFVVFFGKERVVELERRVARKSGNPYWRGAAAAAFKGATAEGHEWTLDEGAVVMAFKLREKTNDDGTVNKKSAYAQGARWALSVEGFGPESHDETCDEGADVMGGPRTNAAAPAAASSTAATAPQGDDDCPF